MVKFIPNEARKILDIGCGEGVFSASLKKPNREIWGVEMNAGAAEIAKKKIRQYFYW